MTLILKCTKCGAYTLKKQHCVATVGAHPPRLGADKYGKYRRALKQKG